MTAPDAAGIEAALAAGLAAHRLIHDDRRRDPFRCTCDKWVAVVAANGRDREGVTIEDQHRAHQAAALLPVVTQAQAEALREAADDPEIVEAATRAVWEHFFDGGQARTYGRKDWPPPEQHMPWWTGVATAALGTLRDRADGLAGEAS